MNAALIQRLSPAGWRVEPQGDASKSWIRCQPTTTDGPRRGQGWKLHLSAATLCAERVLERALPVLFQEDAPFKVAASAQVLNALNQGLHGISQIGKFITVYPATDEQALRLAAALHEATRGLRGPRVPSDRPLAEASLVHYRYGGFESLHLQTPVGAVLPALRDPSGALVQDRRGPSYDPPAWVADADPFRAHGLGAPSQDAEALVAGRYLITSTLHRSARGAVHMALDVDAPRACVLKSAERDAMLGDDGRDARDRLRHEALMLQRVADLLPAGAAPQLYGCFSEAGDVYLAMEDIPGETLDSSVTRAVAEGHPPSGAQVAAWGQEIAALLQALHEHGLVFRDLKPSNIIRGADGQLRLIDFEMIHDTRGSAPASGLGTRGYLGPQQAAGLPPRPADDIYALGALLYFLATGAEPSSAPDPRDLLGRPVRRLNPAISEALAQVIAACLAADESKRPQSSAQVAQALSAAQAQPPASVTFGAWKEEPAGPQDLRWQQQAQRLYQSLCAVAQKDERGWRWISHHRDAGDVQAPRALGAGNAGTLLCLAELVDGLGLAPTPLAEGARWLRAAPPLVQPPHPGLYVGEAGVVAALLRAGQVLRDPALVEDALRRGAEIATMPHGSPDLYNGTAGRARLHLWLWDETQDPAALQHARAAGDLLLHAAQETAEGGLCWPLPQGFDSMSGHAYPGYAHGAAGIGDVLLDLYAATGDERYRGAALRAARWLQRIAVPQGDGVNWPYEEGGAGGWTYWCHGACGVARFLLHARALDLFPEAGALCAAAAVTTARGARTTNPTQCHGLSGNIELLLDLAQATGDAASRNEAHSLAALLGAFAVEREEGLMFPSESPTVFSPDYLLGYAGVALCLLRLAQPERPHQLSRAGFRFRRSAP